MKKALGHLTFRFNRSTISSGFYNANHPHFAPSQLLNRKSHASSTCNFQFLDNSVSWPFTMYNETSSANSEFTMVSLNKRPKGCCEATGQTWIWWLFFHIFRRFVRKDEIQTVHSGMVPDPCAETQCTANLLRPNIWVLTLFNATEGWVVLAPPTNRQFNFSPLGPHLQPEDHGGRKHGTWPTGESPWQMEVSARAQNGSFYWNFWKREPWAWYYLTLNDEGE